MYTYNNECFKSCPKEAPYSFHSVCRKTCPVGASCSTSVNESSSQEDSTTLSVKAKVIIGVISLTGAALGAAVVWKIILLKKASKLAKMVVPIP